MKLLRKETLIALFITIGLNTAGYMVESSQMTPVLSFFDKFSQSVYSTNIVDVAMFFGILFLINYVRTNGIRRDLTGGIVGTLLSFLYIWSFAYRDNCSSETLIGNGYQVFLTIIRLIAHAGLFYYIFELAYIHLSTVTLTEKDSKLWRLFAFFSITIFAVWLIYIVLGYPASVSGDAVAQLNQFLGGEWSTHHPPLSTAIMGVLVTAGLELGNGAIGLAFYLFLQTAVCAIIISYSLMEMIKLGVSTKVSTFVMLIFACLPIFGMYAQYYEKDLLYSIVTLLWAVESAKLVINRKAETKTLVFFFIIGLLCCFLRNNGIYAVIPLYVGLMCLNLKDKGKWLFAGGAIITALIYVLINTCIFPAMGIGKGHIREALSLPMQQTTVYIRDYGEELTDEEIETINAFFDNPAEITSVYDPYCADPVKSHVIVKVGNLPMYFRNYFSMGFKHPGAYFNAFMSNNYGYLAPNAQNMEPAPTGEMVLSQLSEHGIDGGQNQAKIQILKSLSFMNVVFPFMRYFTMPGFYTWILIALIAIQIKHKKWDALVLMIPSIINVLVCLASPLCNGLRYELPVVLQLPLLIAITAFSLKVPKGIKNINE